MIYYWIRRTATWNLFVLYNNEKAFIFQNKYFNITQKPAFCPAFAPPLHEIKPFDVIYELYKMKQFHWLLCVAKKSRHCQSLLVEWKLTAKAELNCKRSTNLEENAGKIKSVFVIWAALWAETLGRCLENYRSWKNILGKLVVMVNLETIWFEFWMKGA